jgi:hypothetical protein
MNCARMVSVALVALILLVSNASAWWDTVITVVRPAPLMKEIEAEAIPGMTADRLVNDPQSNGGAGGKALVLTPGGPGVSIEVNLKPGIYGLWGIVRSPDQPAALGIATLTLQPKSAATSRSWTMPITCKDTYFSGVMMYFPIDAEGPHTLSLKLESDPAKLHADWSAGEPGQVLMSRLKAAPLTPVWLDRLEIRDVLGHLGPIKQTKTRRMLTTDEELAAVRKQFADDPNAAVELKASKETFTKTKAPRWFTTGRSPQERAKRNEELWQRVPDFNSQVSHDISRWHDIIGRDRAGLIGDYALGYVQTGHTELAWDGALLLVAMSEKYPAIDYFAQGITKAANLSMGADAFSINSGPPGKTVYRGWAGPDAIRMMQYYDQLFDFIRDNQAFADEVGKRIPGIRTPKDVVQFLDTRLLRHIVDGASRNQIEGTDAPKVLAPLVLGPGPDSDRMLHSGIFSKMNMNMTFRGGIDDHAISSYSRDGVHYIGSAGYLSDDLLEIATLLHKYRLAGGDPKFDLLDEQRYPQMRESSATLQQIRVAGGFRLLQGDAGDLRNSREPEKWPDVQPSRILGGYGMSVLETGQFQADPLLMRGMGLYFGIGRGHSQHDSLNLELFAHGTRVSPDLGGREEGSNRGYPNMRSTRVHNVVEVDDDNFRNLSPSSVTSGTGWNTAFVAAPGVQFMEHHARATSHPNVSRYARQTVMIDQPDSANSYVFDVFRVAGGKTHTYNFHGAPTDELVVNTTLTATLDKDATAYLSKHFQGSRKMGVAPAMLQVDWPMKPALQKHYQRDRYQADRTVTTRLALFGVEGHKVLVGNAYSDRYDYNFPILHVRARGEQDGRQSVYPAIIEPFAGKPFILDKRQLPITPASSNADAAVALLVQTTSGTTDLLYASGDATRQSTIAGETQADGKFAFVSTDAAGLLSAQLVGGTALTHQSVKISVPSRAYSAVISAVNYPKRSFTVDQTLPVQLFENQLIGIANPSGLTHTFKLQSGNADGKRTTLIHHKTARYYQSAVIGHDASRNGIECEIEPPIFGADPLFINGTTISNEKFSKFARTTIEEGDRWMHMDWPGYRTSFPNWISEVDVPDADGDGKRTLKMIGSKKPDEPPTTLLTLEATRFSSSGDTFYFKLPTEERYQRGGWAFNNHRLVNEDGSKTWRSLYPGSSYLWMPEAGSNMGPADFTDEDGDGLAKLSAYVYGPGDRMVLDTFVHMRRVSEQTYELRANTPCTLSFAAEKFKNIQVSGDGKSFKKAEVQQRGDRVVLNVTESDLGVGVMWLRITP